MTANDIENIRTSVTMRQLVDMCGYKVNRSGMMCCPFHHDDHPSMKIYGGKRGYYCFVCNEGGDIFDFVMKHDNLEFPAAAQRIAEMFSIPVSDGKTTLSDAERAKIQKRKEALKAKERAKEAHYRKLTEISEKLRIHESIKARCEPLSDLWCGAQDNIVKLSIQWEQLFQEKI